MSTGFNCARASLLAQREGISYSEACARMARKGVAMRQRRKLEAERKARLEKNPPYWMKDNA